MQNDSSPIEKATSVVPSDLATAGIAECRGIYVGGAGDLTVILIGMTTSITFKAIAAGVIHPIRAKQVLATGTTATNLLAVS